LQDKYRAQGLVVLGITNDVEADLPRVREFVKEKNGTHTILWDDSDGPDGAFGRYDISPIPVTYVIDRKGRVVRWPPAEGEMIGDAYHQGFRAGTEREIDALVAKVLAEK
jgi:hypothetical protein